MRKGMLKKIGGVFLGFMMTAIGAWMLSPFAVVYGKAVMEFGGGFFFILLFLFALFMSGGGIVVTIASLRARVGWVSVKN